MQVGDDRPRELILAFASDNEEESEGENIDQYINQCVFLAEWNLFYQLLSGCSQVFWQPNKY